MATVNLGNQGLSDGDTIDGYLSDYLGNGDTVEIPTGTYVWDGGGLDFSADNDVLVGLGNPGDVQWDLTGTFQGGMYGGDNVRWENVQINGDNPDPKAGIDVGSSSVMKNIYWLDGGQQSEDRFTYGGNAGGGRATIQNSLWGQMGNNGWYVDHIPATIENCVSVNNNVSGMRVGHADISNPNGSTTYIRDSQIYVAQEPPTDGSNSSNGRGVRIREACDIVIDNCTFVYEDVNGASQPVVISDKVSGDVNLTVQNCDFVINSGSMPVEDESGNHNVTVTNCRVAGNSYDLGSFDYDEVSDITVTHPSDLIGFDITDTTPFNGGSGDNWAWAAPSGGGGGGGGGGGSTGSTWSDRNPLNVWEDFEDQSLSEYSGDTGSFSIVDNSTYSPREGSYQLTASGVTDHDMILRDDVTTQRGVDYEYYVLEGASNEGSFFLFHGDSTNVGTVNGYAIRIEKDSGIEVYEMSGGNPEGTLLDSTGTGLPTEEYLRVYFYQDDGSMGGSDGDIVVEVYDIDDTLIDSLTTNDLTHSSGSWGWATDGTDMAYVDYVLEDPGSDDKNTGGSGGGGGGTTNPPPTPAERFVIQNEGANAMSYQFLMTGRVTRVTSVSSTTRAEASDKIEQTGSGLYIVKGSVRAGEADTFDVNGSFLSWSASNSESTYTLITGGDSASVAAILEYDTDFDSLSFSG